MNRKWMVSAVLLFALAISAGADNWGLGLRLGAGENSPTTMQEDYDIAFDYGFASKEISKGPGILGLEALYEWNLSEETEKLGVRLGVDGYGTNEVKLNNSVWLGINEYKATESTVAFPLTVYYKRDNGIKKWSWMGGVGVTLLRSEIEEKLDWAKDTSSKSKVFPHLIVGAEYRFSKLFALGLEGRYNISAKIKDDGDVVSDRSGFGVLLTGRFYF